MEEYCRHDEYAIAQALDAQAYDVAADLIESTTRYLSVRGYSSALAAWIDALPEEITLLHPRLLLLRARIFLSAGEQYAQSWPLLEAASMMASDKDPVLRAQILLTRSMVLFRRGDYPAMQEMCEQALAIAPAGECALRADIHVHIGMCQCLMGHLDEGIAALQRALHLCDSETAAPLIAKVRTLLANAYNWSGHLDLSEYHRVRAISCYELLSDEWGRIENVIGMAALKWFQGALVEAEHLLTNAVAAARQAGYRRGEAYAQAHSGSVYLDQDRHQQALAAFEESLILARRLDHFSLANDSLCHLALTYLRMGDTHTALLLVSPAEQEVLLEGILHSHDRSLRLLTLGRIFLHLQRYSEAQASIAEALRTSEERQVHLPARLLLAACLLAQDDVSAALRHVEKALDLARQTGSETRCLLELRHLPDLQQTLHAMPEAAHLRPLLWQYPVPTPAIPSVTLTERASIRALALGEPAVLINDTPIRHWRMPLAMELFFFLLDSNRPLRKEQIIAALWPEVDKQVDQTFRSTLHYLRQALGIPCLISQAGSYALNLESHTWYDAVIFQGRYAIAKQALTINDDDAARSAFLSMVDLYRGDYLQTSYNDWCKLRRDELRKAYLDARYQLAQIAYRAGQSDESLLHYQHMLTVDNCLEEAHYGIMCCYLSQGKRGLALRQYQSCSELLRHELAVAPGAALQNLYQRIVNSSSD